MNHIIIMTKSIVMHIIPFPIPFFILKGGLPPSATRKNPVCLIFDTPHKWYDIANFLLLFFATLEPIDVSLLSSVSEWFLADIYCGFSLAAADLSCPQAGSL